MRASGGDLPVEGGREALAPKAEQDAGGWAGSERASVGLAPSCPRPVPTT